MLSAATISMCKKHRERRSAAHVLMIFFLFVGEACQTEERSMGFQLALVPETLMNELPVEMEVLDKLFGQDHVKQLRSDLLRMEFTDQSKKAGDLYRCAAAKNRHSAVPRPPLTSSTCDTCCIVQDRNELYVNTPEDV